MTGRLGSFESERNIGRYFSGFNGGGFRAWPWADPPKRESYDIKIKPIVVTPYYPPGGGKTASMPLDWRNKQYPQSGGSTASLPAPLFPTTSITTPVSYSQGGGNAGKSRNKFIVPNLPSYVSPAIPAALRLARTYSKPISVGSGPGRTGGSASGTFLNPQPYTGPITTPSWGWNLTPFTPQQQPTNYTEGGINKKLNFYNQPGMNTLPSGTVLNQGPFTNVANAFQHPFSTASSQTSMTLGPRLPGAVSQVSRPMPRPR